MAARATAKLKRPAKLTPRKPGKAKPVKAKPGKSAKAKPAKSSKPTKVAPAPARRATKPEKPAKAKQGSRAAEAAPAEGRASITDLDIGIHLVRWSDSLADVRAQFPRGIVGRGQPDTLVIHDFWNLVPDAVEEDEQVWCESLITFIDDQVSRVSISHVLQPSEVPAAWHDLVARVSGAAVSYGLAKGERGWSEGDPHVLAGAKRPVTTSIVFDPPTVDLVITVAPAG